MLMFLKNEDGIDIMSTLRRRIKSLGKPSVTFELSRGKKIGLLALVACSLCYYYNGTEASFVF